MSSEKYFIDDRVTISKDIKEMSKDELQQAISKLEEELKIREQTA